MVGRDDGPYNVRKGVSELEAGKLGKGRAIKYTLVATASHGKNAKAGWAI